MLSVHTNVFVILLMLITIRTARSIVNSPPDKNNNQAENQVSLTSSNFFSRFKKQSFGTRELKKGTSQFSFWSTPGFRPPSIGLFGDPQITSVINNHNLPQTQNDPVDLTGVSNDIGSANGYVFPRPAKIQQGFKTFGLNLGKFGHLHGTGAFYSHHEYPHEIR